MAGSLNHIVGPDGRFTMDSIENIGDAHEALEECYALIYHLSGKNSKAVSAMCKKLRFPDPWENEFGDDPKQPMKFP